MNNIGLLSHCALPQNQVAAVTSPIDDLFERIMGLSRTISELPDSDPERARLERERQRLRDEAAAIADTGRHPDSVKFEIQAIEQRLTAIERLKITKGYQEKRGGKIIQDPGAYSANINRLLDEQYEEEVATLTDRLSRLRSITIDVVDP